MNFLRRFFRTKVLIEETYVAPLEDHSVVQFENPIKEVEAACSKFNWNDYQSSLKWNKACTIGGSNVIDWTEIPSLVDEFFDHDHRVSSPSTRFVLFSVYGRRTEDINQMSDYRNNINGMTPLMTIFDFSNRTLVLYGNDKLVYDRKSESENELIHHLSSYWLSDAELVLVHVKNLNQIVQCVYTIDHEEKTYKEDIYEYDDLDDKLAQHLDCLERGHCRTVVNPLLIHNKAYYTLLVEDNFYLFPWIPSNNNKNVFKKIKLNRNDTILTNEEYYLIPGKNSCHYNYGHKTFFYIGEDDFFRTDEDDRASSTQMACIDFSKQKHVDFSHDVDLSFEIVEFSEIDGNDEYSWINAEIFASTYYLSFHGRYIIYNAHDDDEHSYIYDLQNMTVDILDDQWLYNPLICSNTLLIFKHNLECLGYEISFAHLNQTEFKSLATLCREKLIYSETKINVPPKLLDIIFTSQ